MSLLDKIRNKIPLNIRIKIGPYLGYFTYIINTYILKIKQPKVLTLTETIDLIIKENLSVIRFGDGEMSLINGSNLAFQKHDQNLVKRLDEILKTNLDKLLICIPDVWGKIDKLNKRDYWFFIHHLFRYRQKWYARLSFDKIYGNTFVTRPFLTFKDKTPGNYIFKKIFLIWQNQNVILIEGEKSRLGIGNDMFSSVASIQRILCPAENAYSKYTEILAEAKKISKDRLILISLGPTAKVLAYDLFLLGYRVLDIGHIDMEYEMFLRGETKLVKVKYKYFNEINERNPEDCADEKYQSQIIAKIV